MSSFSNYLHVFQSMIHIGNHFCGVNPFPNDNFWTLPISKSLQTTISKLMKMAESSPNGKKTLWEKGEIARLSNLFFSHSVFKRSVMQTRKIQGLFGEEF